MRTPIRRRRAAIVYAAAVAAVLHARAGICAVTAHAYALHGVAGSTVPGYDGTFTTSDANPAISDFAALIDWGDGTSTPATITYDASFFLYTVQQDHTYAAPGIYTTTVTVSDSSDFTQSAASSTATIADAPIDASGVYFDSTVGQPATQTIATFTDANPYLGVSDFSAAIDWGDGAASPGNVVVAATPGAYSVSATHTYVLIGLKTVTISVSDRYAGHANATSYTGDRIFANGFE